MTQVNNVVLVETHLSVRVAMNVQVRRTEYDNGDVTLTVEYDTPAMEKVIEEQVIPQLEQATDITVRFCGGKALVGWPSDMHSVDIIKRDIASGV